MVGADGTSLVLTAMRAADADIIAGASCRQLTSSDITTRPSWWAGGRAGLALPMALMNETKERGITMTWNRAVIAVVAC